MMLIIPQLWCSKYNLVSKFSLKKLNTKPHFSSSFQIPLNLWRSLRGCLCLSRCDQTQFGIPWPPQPVSLNGPQMYEASATDYSIRCACAWNRFRFSVIRGQFSPCCNMPEPLFLKTKTIDLSCFEQIRKNRLYRRSEFVQWKKDRTGIVQKWIIKWIP